MMAPTEDRRIREGLIHRSAWKVNSPKLKFAYTEFYEVPRRFYTHGVFPHLLEAFDDDELRVGGLAAQLPEGSVFR
jgi:hypothetical protein